MLLRQIGQMGQMGQMGQILTTGLIAIGLADTLANRAGPGGISLWLREWLGDEQRPAWVQAAVGCVYCFAFYGALLGAVATHPRNVQQLVRRWLAGFGLAVAFFRVVEK